MAYQRIEFNKGEDKNYGAVFAWKNTSGKGPKLKSAKFSIPVEALKEMKGATLELSIWPNDNKKSDNSPDYSISLSKIVEDDLDAVGKDDDDF